MKKIILIAFAFFCCGISFAQNFNYQAVVRDASNNPVANQSIGVLVRIIEGSPTGSVVYNEVHTVTSNAQGVITLPVGGGTSGANFLAIDWSSQNQWIDIQVDITGGTNYVQIGTSKLQFVPYALYALNSTNATNAGPFSYASNVVSNNNGNIVADDFVFGSSQLDGNGSNAPALNNRMFFDKSKAAFRAGYTPGDEWDEANVGTYSVAFGESAMASNTNAFAMGRNANATGLEAFAFGTNAGGFGNYSRGIGLNARANGENATAIGRQLNANSLAEIQLGQYSNFVSGSADTWVPTDRLFVIGNGQPDINLALNSDALVMLKNGNTILNGQLTLDGDNQGAGRAFTLPAQDGSANQIMQTDGAGNVSWVTPAVSAIPNGGTNGFVLATNGSGVLSWVTNDDLDADPTNEIELPEQTGENGKFLTTDGTAVSWQDVPNELPTGGTSGQILSTDGSGVYSWVNQTATAAFSTTGNVTSNAPGDTTTDDFVFGSTQIDDIPGLEDNNRIVFDKSNGGAFRAGSAFNTNRFNQDQMGTGSVAFGVNNLVSGTYGASTGSLNIVSGYAGYAHGERNTVSSSYGITTGSDNIVTGNFASAHGRNLTSESLLQTTFGTYNTAVAGNASSFIETDRLFVIGNGTADFEGVNNSDALVMLKNGNTTLNGTLTIDGDNQDVGAGYTLPAQDGTANQVMTTDGAGNVSWANVASGSTGPFSTTANVTSNANGIIATDDFVFGSTQLANDTGINDDSRMFFDKSKSAFRVGKADGSEWDDVNVGNQSMVLGNNSTASNFGTVAIGESNVANGISALAIGSNLTAESFGQTSIGLSNTQVAGNATQYVETDRLFVIGNGSNLADESFRISPRSDALVMLKNGNTTLNGTLTIDGDNQDPGASYTFPAQDGTANQVMTTDGSGNVSWVDAPSGTSLPAGGTNGQILSTDGAGGYSWVDDATGTSTFSTTASVTSNANGTIATDDFVFGSTQLDNDTNTTDDDNRMFFNKTKGAFRAGHAESIDWDDSNVGNNSIALGYRSTATGNTSIGIGRFANALSDESIAIGHAASTTNALRGISMGYRTVSQSKEQITIGSHNTLVTGDANNWVSTDRLFVIGNGDADSNGGANSSRSDALVMLKNGNTTLNGTFTIDGDNAGAGTSYTLPAQDGTANQVMTTDGSGNVSWANAAASGAFTTTANVTSNANGAIATDDFVFGSTQLDNDTNKTNDDARMFFDKSKAAFRVGKSTDNSWDDANVGAGSIAIGETALATGAKAISVGEGNWLDASATNAIALGNFNEVIANSNNSIAIGDDHAIEAPFAYALGYANVVNAQYGIGLGNFTNVQSYGQISLGQYNNAVTGNANAFVPTDRLFVIGNGTATMSRSDALVILKNGNTTLNGLLTIDGDNAGSGASYTLPAQDGTANQVMTTDGSGNVSWAAPVADGDSDPTNEIELPAGGTNGQVLQTDGSGGYSWTNNTVAPGAYTAATLATGWQYYNAAFSVTNFQDPRYRKVNNVVTLEGLCRKNGAISNAETIMTLPAGFRPLKTRIFTVETENGAMRVDINPSGTVIIATGFNINQNWVSLEGLTFSID